MMGGSLKTQEPRLLRKEMLYFLMLYFAGSLLFETARQRVVQDASCKSMSLFNHKQKYHRGRVADHQIWIFGICDPSTTPATGYLEIVEGRNTETLLPIIEKHVLPSSTVHSDKWRACNRVKQLPGLADGTVNHSVNFIHPGTGVQRKTSSHIGTTSRQNLST